MDKAEIHRRGLRPALAVCFFHAFALLAVRRILANMARPKRWNRGRADDPGRGRQRGGGRHRSHRAGIEIGITSIVYDAEELQENRAHMRITAASYSSLALLATLCLLPLAAHSRVWFVRNDGTGDAPTIQAAIDSAAAGDTITLAKGIFREQSSITCCDKNTLVINSESGPDSTIIAPASESSFISIASCGNISFDGISFRDFPGSALSFWMTSEITISNCGFFNNGHYYYKYAILFEWCNGIDVRNSKISGNLGGIMYYELNSNVVSYNNIYLTNIHTAINLNDVTNCSIANSIISGSKYGIRGLGANISLQCNNVFNNEVNYAILYYLDPTGQNGNISVDAQFCSIDPVAYDNYYLQSDSPCAPGNHPDAYPCGLIGCEPVGCGTTGIEKTSWSNVKQLFK
jgi:hypothetical protein